MSTELNNLIGLRFREEVERLGGVSKILEFTGVSRGTIYNWFDSGLIPANVLNTLWVRGMDTSYVVTGNRTASSGQGGHVNSEDIAYAMSPTLRGEIIERDQKYGVKLTIEQAVELVRGGAYVFVPYYNLPLSGGGGADVLEQPPKQFNFYTRSYVEKRGLNPADLAEFPVRGNSMMPELMNDSTVLCDRSKTEPVITDIYAARVRNELIVKYLQLLPDRSIRVTSKNSEEYPEFVIPASDLEQGLAKVIGRVVRKAVDR